MQRDGGLGDWGRRVVVARYTGWPAIHCRVCLGTWLLVTFWLVRTTSWRSRTSVWRGWSRRTSTRPGSEPGSPSSGPRQRPLTTQGSFYSLIWRLMLSSFQSYSTRRCLRDFFCLLFFNDIHGQWILDMLRFWYLGMLSFLLTGSFKLDFAVIKPVFWIVVQLQRSADLYLVLL